MIVAGFGFTSRATADSFAQALAATGYDGALARIATPADKADAPPMRLFAETRGLPIAAIPAEDVARTLTHTQSQPSQKARQTGSVAEAAALAAAGPGATLLIARCISTDRMATCAIAKGADT